MLNKAVIYLQVLIWSVFLCSLFKMLELLYYFFQKVSQPSMFFHSWFAPELTIIFGLVFAIIAIVICEIGTKLTYRQDNHSFILKCFITSLGVILFFHIFGIYNLKMSFSDLGVDYYANVSGVEPVIIMGNIFVFLIYIFFMMGMNVFLTRRQSLLTKKTTPIILAILIILAISFEFYLTNFNPNRRYFSNKPQNAVFEVGEQQHPNILLLIIDTLRADYVGCYNDSLNLTPNIDRIASAGSVFLNNYANSPWTTPSFASMYTSDTPYRSFYRKETGHKVEKVEGDLEHFAVNKMDDNIPNLMSFFADRGYDVSAFQANYNAGSELNFNMSHRFFLDCYNRTRDSSITFIFYRGVIEALKSHLGLDLSGFLNIYDDFNNKFCDYGGSLTEYLINFTDGKAAAPFLITVNFMDVHEFLDRNPAEDYKDILENSGIKIPLTNNCEMNDYMRSIVYDDAQVGMIYDYLSITSRLDNTVLIITSDHGEQFNEHGYQGHGFNVYNEEIKVPLILHWPDKFPAGAKFTHPTCLMDIFPTLIDLCGFKGDHLDLKGRQLFDDSDNNRFIYAGYTQLTYDKTAVINNDWKLIYDSYTGLYELYNLIDDPQELNSLPLPDYPAAYPLLDSLEAQGLHDGQYQIELKKRHRLWEKETVIDRDQLKAIGYVK